MKKFQLSSLEDLPDYDEVLEKLMLINAPTQETLFHTRTIMDEDGNVVEEHTLEEAAADNAPDDTADDEIPEFLEGEQFEVFD